MVVGPGAEVLHVQVRVLGREAADDVRDRDAPDIVLRVDAEIADGLEVYALHRRHVLSRELHDGAQLPVVLAGDDAADQHYGQPSRRGVFHSTQLRLQHGLAVFGVVGLLRQSVEAQVGRRDAALVELLAEPAALRQLHAVGIELDEPEAQLPRQRRQLEDILPHCRLAAAELYGRVFARRLTVEPQEPFALGQVRLV